jgi:ATP/ADP translocase
METDQVMMDTRVLKTLTWLPVILVLGAVVVLIVNYIPAWKIIAVLEGFFLLVFTLVTVGLNIYLFWTLFRS